MLAKNKSCTSKVVSALHFIITSCNCLLICSNANILSIISHTGAYTKKIL